jgi:hypothetical protein
MYCSAGVPTGDGCKTGDEDIAATEQACHRRSVSTIKIVFGAICGLIATILLGQCFK